MHTPIGVAVGHPRTPKDSSKAPCQSCWLHCVTLPAWPLDSPAQSWRGLVGSSARAQIPATFGSDTEFLSPVFN